MLKNILNVALPAVVSMLFIMIVQTVNIAFVGHLDTDKDEKVAGVGLGNLYLNMFSQSIACGLNGGISTLVA